jgi:ubiquinone/menaquinone biosynthesis C-methylase UbiE
VTEKDEKVVSQSGATEAVELTDKVREANRRFFDRIAGEYERINERVFTEAIPFTEDILKELGERSQGDAALDLGCGTGNVSRRMARFFPRSYGVDISFNMLKEAHGLCGRIVGDCLELPFKDNSFDLVVAYGALHHIYDFPRLFSEAYRVLSPGGFFYVDHEIDRQFTRHFKVAFNAYRRIYGMDKRYRAKDAGFDPEEFRLAEYHAYEGGGLNIDELKEILSQAGFGETRVYHHGYGATSLTNRFMRLLGIKRLPRFLAPFFALVAEKELS